MRDIMVMSMRELWEVWAGRRDESPVDSTCWNNEGGEAWGVNSARRQKTKEERLFFAPPLAALSRSRSIASLQCEYAISAGSRVAPTTTPVDEWHHHSRFLVGVQSGKPRVQRHPCVLAPSHHATHVERRTSSGIFDAVPIPTAASH